MRYIPYIPIIGFIFVAYRSTTEKDDYVHNIWQAILFIIIQFGTFDLLYILFSVWR